MKVQVQKGDLFCVSSAGIISRMIIAVEWFHSKDGRAHFGHAGIVTDDKGGTLEALWTVKHAHLDRYRGQRMFVVRPLRQLNRGEITPTLVDRALEEIEREYLGRIYPVWRIPLHLVPPLAKWLSWKRKNLVCSELVARYERLIGVRDSISTGINPDDLDDRWRLLCLGGVMCKVIFDGRW